MTSTGKIAVSLPLPQIDAAKQAVREGRAKSVSSYVSEALARRQQDDALADLVAEWMVEDGIPTSDDYAWADAVLADAGVDRPRRGPTRA